MRWGYIFVCLFVCLFAYFFPLSFSLSTFIHLCRGLFSCPFFLCTNAHTHSNTLYLFDVPFSFLHIILFALSLVLCVHSVEIYNTHWYYYYTHFHCCSLIILLRLFRLTRIHLHPSSLSLPLLCVHLCTLVDNDCAFHPELNAATCVYVYSLVCLYIHFC